MSNGLKGTLTFTKKLVCRVCGLADSLEKQNVVYEIDIYPTTIEEYENAKDAWAGLKEKTIVRYILWYKGVTIHKPK
jgi:transcription elongation factor Elf1